MGLLYVETDQLIDISGDKMKLIFFFKHKTAYEVLRILGGSEMCIRDRAYAARRRATSADGYLSRGRAALRH